MARRITDPFFRKLHERLESAIRDRIVKMTEGGSSVRGMEGILIDPFNTTLMYEKDVAVIKAYQDIVNLCYEIDREVFGTKHIEDDGDN